MNCNCSNVYKFPKAVNSCNSAGFTSMFAGLEDGSYLIELEFLNGRHLIGITKAGNDIEPVGVVTLNESYTYTGKIVNSAGAYVPLYISTVPYDCFQFETKLLK